MGLAQFGGRGNSSAGGGGGKEIGEVFLVPKSVTSADFVEEGQVITNSAYPELFSKLNGSTGVDNFQPFTMFGDGRGGGVIGARLVYAQAFINGESWYVTTAGGVLSTTDCITFTDRGNLSAVNAGISSSLMWNAFQSTTSDLLDFGAYRIYIFNIGSRVCVMNTSGGFPTLYFTDDGGATWTGTTVPALAAIAATTTHNIAFNGSAAIIASATEAYVTTDGTTWTNTGLTISATPGVYADSSVMIITSGTTQHRSTTNGSSWSTTTNPAAITCRYRLPNGDLLGDSFSTNTTVYRSSDDGASWVNHGTATGALSSNISVTNSFLHWRKAATGEIVALAGAAVGTYTGGASTISVRTSADSGVTWSAARTITGLFTTSSAGVWLQWLDASSGSVPIVISSGIMTTLTVRQFIPTSGAVHGIAPLTGTLFELGTAPDVTGFGFAPEDIATNGTTVVMVGNSGGLLTSSRAAFRRRHILVGDFTAGFNAVELPNADRWCGITWNPTAGRFFLTGLDTEFLYSSTDGYTWTTTPTASLPASVKNTIPRTHGATTFFIPAARGSADTAAALVFMVAHTNGQLQFLTTKFTAVFNRPGTAASASVGRSVFESSFGCISSWVSGMVGSVGPQCYTEDIRWAASTSATGVIKATTMVGSTIGGETVGVHGNVMVHRGSTTQYATYIGDVTSIRNTSAALPATKWITGLYVNGTTMTLFTTNNSIFTSVDWGQTWQSDTLTSIPATAVVFYVTVVNDRVVMFTASGTYILDTSNAPSATKVVNTGWTGAPAGMKYVVKAKP